MSFFSLLSSIVVSLVGVFHIYIFNIEALRWYRGGGAGFGSRSTAQLHATATMAANQGYYNLLLATGLLLSSYYASTPLMIFFVTTVAGAGLFGFASTGAVKILLAQGIPSTAAYITIILKQTQEQEQIEIGYWISALLFNVASYFLGVFIKNRIADDKKFHDAKEQK